MKIGLQLYSIKEEMEKDFYGTLEKVAKAGYDGVEFAGYFGQQAADIKAALNRLNLEVCAVHTGVNDPEGLIDFERGIGNANIVCPGCGVEDGEKLNAAVDMMKNAVSVLSAAGFKVGYHNHSHEFRKVGDEYALDVLYTRVPELLCEIDVFWAAVGGVDPAEYIRKYSGRVPLLHLKDMDEDGGNTEIGYGKLDMTDIIKTAGECGGQWLIVEQERFVKYPQMESIKISCQWIREVLDKLGL